MLDYHKNGAYVPTQTKKILTERKSFRIHENFGTKRCQIKCCIHLTTEALYLLPAQFIE